MMAGQRIMHDLKKKKKIYNEIGKFKFKLSQISGRLNSRGPADRRLLFLGCGGGGIF